MEQMTMENLIIPLSAEHPWGVVITDNDFIIQGNFSYLVDKEVIKSKVQSDSADLRSFLGMNYYSSRSYKKCILFVLIGSLLECFNVIIDKLNDLAEKANTILNLFDKSVSLPEWLNYSLNVIAALTVLAGIVYFFSAKKVVEISFAGKRFCINRKNITDGEFYYILNGIKERRKIIGYS